MNLEEWRKEIDGIDARIVGLINRRAALAQKIGGLKKAAGLPVLDAARETEVLLAATAGNEGIMSNAAMIEIFRRILRESRKIQAETPAGAISTAKI